MNATEMIKAPDLRIRRVVGAWQGGELMPDGRWVEMTARVGSKRAAQKMMDVRLTALGVLGRWPVTVEAT